MPISPRFSGRRWWLIPLAAVLFIALTDAGRLSQARRLRAVDHAAEADAYAGGRQWLVLPEANATGYQWLAETRQMLETGELRIRHVGYENAPNGREVHSASPYRWWLGSLAWMHHRITGKPLGESVEEAALLAGPLLHLWWVIGATLYGAQRFGSKPAAFLALGLAVLFPLTGDFAPGAIDDHGLALVVALWSVLLLAGGLRGARTDFILSGVAGGLGLWISAATLAPVLGAVALGGLILAVVERRASGGMRPPANPGERPWSLWALAGAITSLLAYFAEYYPGHLAMRLEVNHPLYGVAWLGLGQFLQLVDQWRTRNLVWNFRTISRALLAFAGLAALPVAMRWLGSTAFLVAHPQASRLADLTHSPVAANFATWVNRDGISPAILATLLPFALLVPLVFSAAKKDADRFSVSLLVLTGGALVAGVVLACMQLQWWGICQVLLLVAVVAAWPANAKPLWLAALVLLPGAVYLAVEARPRDESHFTQAELEGLIERDIAHWVAAHAGAETPTIFAAPGRTPGLDFFGGLRGLGSPNWENPDGLSASVSIATASTAEEAQALLAQRGVTHIILPSWDTELDEFVVWANRNPNDTFLGALRRWALPPWLKPLPYRLPEITGLEGQSVVVLEINENADRALALSRLADYALEVQDMALAAAANDSLKPFSTSLPALIARAEIEKARENPEGVARALEPLLQSVANGLDRVLPWDRRVSLVVVLAQADRRDLAVVQLRRCIAEASAERLRSLGAGSLYRLLVLSKALAVPLPEPLRAQALALLPVEARARL